MKDGGGKDGIQCFSGQARVGGFASISELLIILIKKWRSDWTLRQV
jgi:hypothetical protein